MSDNSKTIYMREEKSGISADNSMRMRIPFLGIARYLIHGTTYRMYSSVLLELE
jgi:hypothetical protein